MATIAYDFPVKDLIAQLDATKHVSHVAHRKTKVTVHHNGARLSHEGVLAVWQVRPASAHLNVDATGSVAQFVRINEYAWATGSTPGNADSISIEMCNETLGPEWRVSETTWRSAARLAGWLFARVIGARPTHENFVRHKYWSATACAGPHIDTVYDRMLAQAQKTFDEIVHGIITKGGNQMVRVVKGDQSDEHWLVEVNIGGAQKRWLQTETVSRFYQILLKQQSHEEVPQWVVDWASTGDPIGE